MSRIPAALSHLLLSIIIFSVVIWILVFFWYPTPHFSASGGWQGLKIAAGVDLVLGPLLTLIIFDIKKPRKKLMGDLTVIAMMQFTALGWGISTIYQQRPLAVVFWEDGFYSVPASALNNQNFNKEDYRGDNIVQPTLIYVEKPNTIAGLKQVANIVVNEHIAPHHQINLYRTLDNHFADIKPFQVDINEIVNSNAEMKADLEAIFAETNTRMDEYLYFSLYSKYYNIILLFSHQGILENYITVPLREQ